MQATKLPGILERLAASLVLFRGTCVTLIEQFMGEQQTTSRDISRPNMFNTPWHRPLLMFSGEVGALIVVKSSLLPFYQPRLAILFVCQFVSALMLNVGLSHFDAHGRQMPRGAMLLFSATL
jgi:hypothetical protein